MSMRISPIQYGDSRIVRFVFDAERVIERNIDNQSLVAGESQLSVQVSNSFTQQDSLIICDCSIELNWTIKASAEEPDSDVRIECNMNGLAICPKTAAQEDEIREALAMNGVTFVWGKIRDVIESASRYSSTGLLVLPAIDPASVLEDMKKEGRN